MDTGEQPPMKPIRVLVADDEKPGRERLRNLLKRDARVALVACCGGGAEALQAMRGAAQQRAQVQLLLLDVQMPEIDGFAVVSTLVKEDRGGLLPAVIFVTAHDEYALRAFEAHAIDYLLKPYSDERFQAALDRGIRHVRAGDAQAIVSRMQTLVETIESKHHASDHADVESPKNSVVDRIVIKGPQRVRLLPVEQISWIEADGVYVKLHTRDSAVHLHRALLGSLEGALDHRQFVRIHRSAIVNIDVVEELRQDAHGDYVALLRDRTQVRVGRRFRSRLQERLGQPL
jgi:two-component system LytT family response regulator